MAMDGACLDEHTEVLVDFRGGDLFSTCSWTGHGLCRMCSSVAVCPQTWNVRRRVPGTNFRHRSEAKRLHQPLR